MKRFTDSRKQNAVLFMKEQGMNDALGGVWTNSKSYDHILKIGKGQNQFDVISLRCTSQRIPKQGSDSVMTPDLW